MAEAVLVVVVLAVMLGEVLRLALAQPLEEREAPAMGDPVTVPWAEMEGEGMEDGEKEITGAVEKEIETVTVAVTRGLVGEAEALGAEAETRGEGEGCSEGEACALALGVVTLKLALGEGEALREGATGVEDTVLVALREGSEEAEVEGEREGLSEEELLRGALREALGERLVLLLTVTEPEGTREGVPAEELLGAGVTEREKEGEREAAGEREALCVKDTLGVYEGLGLTVPPTGGPWLGLGVRDGEKEEDLEAAGVRESLAEAEGAALSVSLALPLDTGAETVKLGVAVVAFLPTVPEPLALRETLAQEEGLREKLPLLLLLRLLEAVRLAAAEAEPLPPGVALARTLPEKESVKESGGRVQEGQLVALGQGEEEREEAGEAEGAALRVALRQGEGLLLAHSEGVKEWLPLVLAQRDADPLREGLPELEGERVPLMALVPVAAGQGVAGTEDVGVAVPFTWLPLGASVAAGLRVALTTVTETVAVAMGEAVREALEEGQVLAVTRLLVGMADREALPVVLEEPLPAPPLEAVGLEVLDCTGVALLEKEGEGEAELLPVLEGQRLASKEGRALAVKEGLPLEEREGRGVCEAVAEAGGTVCVCVPRGETVGRGEALSVPEEERVLLLLVEPLTVGVDGRERVRAAVAVSVPLPGPLGLGVSVPRAVALLPALRDTVPVLAAVGDSAAERVPRELTLSVAEALRLGAEAEADWEAVGVPVQEGSLLALLVELAVSLRPALRVPVDELLGEVLACALGE